MSTTNNNDSAVSTGRKKNRGKRNGNRRNASGVNDKAAATATRQEQHLLVLHGSRQTGQLLVGRMDKLRKKLQQRYNTHMVAPDGLYPHQEDQEMRQWWDREGNTYVGLQETLDQIQQVWSSNGTTRGILGFSQGARLAHLLVLCHESPYHPLRLEGLQYVIMVAGYEAPLPTNLIESITTTTTMTMNKLQTPSLHVFGSTDRLIPFTESQKVMQHYVKAQSHQHEGGHHVPMRAANVETYLKFIESHLPSGEASSSIKRESADQDAATRIEAVAAVKPTAKKQQATVTEPDEECLLAQREEVEALQAIFPEEFTLVSRYTESTDTFEHPIRYRVSLDATEEGVWPPHPVSLQITYPPTYPVDAAAEADFYHNNNVMEFSSAQRQACRDAMSEAAQPGMPSVLSCVYAAREVFESGRMDEIQSNQPTNTNNEEEESNESDAHLQDTDDNGASSHGSIKPASPERIQECNLEGLEIARRLIYRADDTSNETSTPSSSSGGSWKYTIGLVGKPSAGKSTFFNAASAFARQRDDKDNALGGATMAPHPFTTIDPNVGYCLVPSPNGSCPEDECRDGLGFAVGCTHGRDHKGRRLIPVMLKDVAGLVPGAYQGRGRGNKFLNDLTDADVLIHVVDASGTADTEGNAVVVATDDQDQAEGGGSHPLNDLAWIRNELIEWVYTNLMFKWDNVKKRGRGRLSDMFSGYGQTQAVLWDVLLAVEKFMDSTEQRDHALDHLEKWDQGDVHRLVSAFLGVRFPMALALNKKDLPSAKKFVREVQDALPVHGAHVGIPLSAKSEMNFVRHHLEHKTPDMIATSGTLPEGVWQCLQSAISLRAPVLVFPVSDMTTYAPLPGMMRFATEDASLPSAAMVGCIESAGGTSPSLWDGGGYGTKFDDRLRDVLVMKPGSCVEDVFLALKRMGALGGEFVRAEGAGDIEEKAKLVPKHERLHRGNRILKIMTNKRREWQAK